ncbi:MAG: hypothetical protein EZS28_039588, partial [Streblomastix strix]
MDKEEDADIEYVYEDEEDEDDIELYGKSGRTQDGLKLPHQEKCEALMLKLIQNLSQQTEIELSAASWDGFYFPRAIEIIPTTALSQVLLQPSDQFEYILETKEKSECRVFLVLTVDDYYKLSSTTVETTEKIDFDIQREAAVDEQDQIHDDSDERIYINSEGWKLQTRKYKGFLACQPTANYKKMLDCPIPEIKDMIFNGILKLAEEKGLKLIQITQNEMKKEVNYTQKVRQKRKNQINKIDPIINVQKKENKETTYIIVTGESNKKMKMDSRDKEEEEGILIEEGMEEANKGMNGGEMEIRSRISIRGSIRRPLLMQMENG